MKFVVYDPETGEPAYVLNGRLMERQGVLHNLEDIKMVHTTKLEIYMMIKEEKDLRTLRGYARDLTLCEFELQKLWGFSEDARFHRFWEAPKCTCPKLDNEDSYTIRQIVNLNCPLHGTDA